MVEQLNLFMADIGAEEERIKKERQHQIAMEIERQKKEREDFLTKNLTTRQHRLVDYLEDNFIKGKYFTIEELCGANLGYVLNTNPKTHDKCVALGNDIREINWRIGSRYSIIVKDKNGSAKLCESELEFETWQKGEKDKLDKKYAYLNNLKYKASFHEQMVIVNLNDKAIEGEFVDVFKGGNRQ